MIRVVFDCDGCDATTIGTDRLKRHFESFSGRDYGFGRWVPSNTIESVTPDGWIAYDLIGATYCPKCWAEINKPKDASR